MRRRRASRLGSRIGYTLAELLIVVVIIGVLTGVSLPRLARVRTQAQVSGATTRFTRAVMAARQVAIQQGKRSYFNTKDDSVWVTLEGNAVAVKAINLYSQYGVNVTSPSGQTTIEYDPRGVATQASKQTFRFRHAASGSVDSLCVSRLGNTIREACP